MKTMMTKRRRSTVNSQMTMLWSRSRSMARSFSNLLKNSSVLLVKKRPHRKSQETASKRKEADEAINKNHAVFQTLLAKAEEKYKPYAEVDMLLASKTMEADDFALLRKEAQDAETELKFLREEADKFYQMFKHRTSKHCRTPQSKQLRFYRTTSQSGQTISTTTFVHMRWNKVWMRQR